MFWLQFLARYATVPDALYKKFEIKCGYNILQQEEFQVNYSKKSKFYALKPDMFFKEIFLLHLRNIFTWVRCWSVFNELLHEEIMKVL